MRRGEGEGPGVSELCRAFRELGAEEEGRLCRVRVS